MKVLISQEIHPCGPEMLEAAGFEVRLCTSSAPTDHATLMRELPGCAALISMPTDRIDVSVLATSGLRVVAQHAVGYDNIDLAEAERQGVVVTHTPGAVTESTAEMTFALMLALARRLREGDQLVRDGRFLGWHPMNLLGFDLFGSRLGIVGPGRIGSAVAVRAQAFGMEVITHSRNSGMSLARLLRESDIVSLHCPLTEATHHLIDAATLRQMKPTAVLINTARGPVVNEADLVEALERGIIAGAGLDVFEREPAVHPGLLECTNVVLAPHLGTSTIGTRARMAKMAAANAIAVLRGDPPPNRIA